jgi:hypothetical protein
LRSDIDLALLKSKIGDLKQTPYFDSNIQTFLVKLHDVIGHMETNILNYDVDIVRSFVGHLWNTHKYVAGTSSNETPYEMQICLTAAVKDWISEECIFTTALTDEKNFHLNFANIWKFISTAITGYDTNNYNPILIQIGLPRIYQYKPMYCIPLYHELGHFIDLMYNITDTTLLIAPPNAAVCPQGLSQQQWTAINQMHRREHFADLFASCYCGPAIAHSLELIAAGMGGTPSHPSTTARVDVISNFLSGEKNGLVDVIQCALTRLKKPKLATFFDEAALTVAFDDVRPFMISNNREMHGIFGAAWQYLEDCLTNRKKDWISQDTGALEIETIVNNLVEKSIRNFDVRERWRLVSA